MYDARLSVRHAVLELCFGGEWQMKAALGCSGFEVHLHLKKSCVVHVHFCCRDNF